MKLKAIFLLLLSIVLCSFIDKIPTTTFVLQKGVANNIAAIQVISFQIDTDKSDTATRSLESGKIKYTFHIPFDSFMVAVKMKDSSVVYSKKIAEVSYRAVYQLDINQNKVDLKDDSINAEHEEKSKGLIILALIFFLVKILATTFFFKKEHFKRIYKSYIIIQLVFLALFLLPIFGKDNPFTWLVFSPIIMPLIERYFFRKKMDEVLQSYLIFVAVTVPILISFILTPILYMLELVFVGF